MFRNVTWGLYLDTPVLNKSPEMIKEIETVNVLLKKVTVLSKGLWTKSVNVQVKFRLQGDHV